MTSTRYIGAEMYFERILDLEGLKSSAFVFGPRMTGKTTLLNALPGRTLFDLLDPEIELEYRARPGLFWEKISALPAGSRIMIDEIQKVPSLLNYVQMGIDRLDHQFILSGSSARKLNRGRANLLGGRSLDLKLHPLTHDELLDHFSIDMAISYGTLPKICCLLLEDDEELARSHLKSYVTTYIKEEIQAEALTRNLGAFQRFLSVAAQSNAQVIEFANISRECSVPASTVKEYYQILEDTLIGFFLWPFDRNERKKARPKFYFFDCGVARALQNRLNDPPTQGEKGFLFETWMINELRRIRDYYGKEHQFSFWRKRNQEIDILISGGYGPLMAIECKSGRTDLSSATANAVAAAFPETPLIVASLNDKHPRRTAKGIDVLPWESVLARYREL
jgi:predicted AAA+ superfamily ATPase